MYPVGAEGVINEHLMEASNAGPTSSETRPPTTEWGAAPRNANPIQSAPYAAEHSARGSKIMAMEQLAADTGGEAILNANDLSHAIARVVQNGSHY